MSKSLLVATTAGDASRGALVSSLYLDAAAEGVASSCLARRMGGAGLQERALAGYGNLLVFSIFIAVDARLAAIQTRPWQLLLDALRLLRGHLATTGDRGSLQGPCGGRGLGDDGIRLLGHDGCAARAAGCVGVFCHTRRAREEETRLKTPKIHVPGTLSHDI